MTAISLIVRDVPVCSISATAANDFPVGVQAYLQPHGTYTVLYPLVFDIQLAAELFWDLILTEQQTIMLSKSELVSCGCYSFSFHQSCCLDNILRKRIPRRGWGHARCRLKLEHASRV